MRKVIFNESLGMHVRIRIGKPGDMMPPVTYGSNDDRKKVLTMPGTKKGCGKGSLFVADALHMPHTEVYALFNLAIEPHNSPRQDLCFS